MKRIILLIFSIFSTTYAAEFQVSRLNLAELGQVAQFDLTENGELIVINRQGELWHTDKKQKLAENLSPHITPAARYGRIASADKRGNFFLWSKEGVYRSSIPLAQHATMQPLAFATIVVTPLQDEYRLGRVEIQDNVLKVVALSENAVLPDARPLLVNLNSNQHDNGHIAVLAKPDMETYRHGVLGDAIEAREVQYLERHTLEPLAQSLHLDGLVFEANQFAILNHDNPKLVVTVSGNNEGAKTSLIGLSGGKLVFEAESEALPFHRWQSPFVFNHKLYAVQMPHLRMRLVEYLQQGVKLNERFVSDGISNHAYGEYETNLAATTKTFAVIPQAGYRHIALLDSHGRLEKYPVHLPAEIIKSKASSEKAYLLLANGDMWVVEQR